MYDFIEEKLDAGKTVIIDGGTGTELEKRGAQMVGAAWCAFATETEPETLRAVHDDYIAAGAEVIAANTYATNFAMIRAAGHGRDKWEQLTSQSVEIALDCQRRATVPVAVAGSFSVMRPMIQGSDRRNPDFMVSEDEERAYMDDQANLLKALGCDLIIMEMMRDDHASVWAIEAALKTGLPVWIGMACRGNENGTPVSYMDEHILFEDIAPAMLTQGGAAAGIMHTDIHQTMTSLEVVRRHWDGPLMAYPESGYFKMPEWQFGDLTPEEFASTCVGWVDGGVQIVGGCCGISVDHIAALKKAAPERAGERKP